MGLGLEKFGFGFGVVGVAGGFFYRLAASWDTERLLASLGTYNGE